MLVEERVRFRKGLLDPRVRWGDCLRSTKLQANRVSKLSFRILELERSQKNRKVVGIRNRSVGCEEKASARARSGEGGGVDVDW